MTWYVSPCAVIYNVYEKAASSLLDADHNGVAEDYGTCFQTDLPVNEMADPGRPPTGQTGYDVVTGVNLHSESTMGYASIGGERRNVNPCP